MTEPDYSDGALRQALLSLALRAHSTTTSSGFHAAERIIAGVVAHHAPDMLARLEAIIALSKLALITTEVAEAAEAVRDGDAEAYGIELADIIIRVLDEAERAGVDIGDAVLKKMRTNETRPFMHGGKLA